MKVSDYIVETIIRSGTTDVFGYPGGMVTHLMDSFDKYKNEIAAHLSYNEQGAAFAACGYAQSTGKTGVAYATSGPGATNLITGICNAYMDSIPVVFITGQVNSFEQKGDLAVRQRGFQETDIVSMTTTCTKAAIRINCADDIRYYLEYAFYLANNGRKGPVLLDIAMDVMRQDVSPELLSSYQVGDADTVFQKENSADINQCINLLNRAKRPVILLGKGFARSSKSFEQACRLINKVGCPVLSSMIAVDLKNAITNYYGFIGAYGERVANFIVAKSDLLITLGARLDVRQVGARREQFAPDADIIRVDIDINELEYRVHDGEFDICEDAGDFIVKLLTGCNVGDYDDWLSVCNKIEAELEGIDGAEYKEYVHRISELIPQNVVITTDVGQNQVWVAQSFSVKEGQRILFSGGHGAMGYSLPSAIGASVGTGKAVYSFNGDGGIQMNIQELQMIADGHLPVKVIVFNNKSLGMIRHFQEMYFCKRYVQTTNNTGFGSPDFSKISDAYGLEYYRIDDVKKVAELEIPLLSTNPCIIEIVIDTDTYVFPKLEYGKPNQDQEPLIDRNMYRRIMEL